MPKIEVIKYPNPILFQKADPVSLNDIKLGKYISIIENMIEVVTFNYAVGLAAPQIGISFRIIIYSGQCGFNTIFNPVIIASKGKVMSYKEQCLSIPGIEKDVRRSRKVTISGFDRDGKSILIKEQKKLTSFIIQHEIDHLNGITLMNK